MKLLLTCFMLIAGMLVYQFCLAKQTDKLPTRYIPKLKQSVSFLGLGTVELGRDWGIGGNASEHPSANKAKQVLKSALANGMTVIDTASSYQLSEERIGQYVPRSKFNYLLITKPGERSLKANDPRCQEPTHDHIYCKKPGGVYDFSRAAIIEDINESLKKLGVNKIDVALLHLDNATAKDSLTKGEALQTLRDLKAQGKIGYIGVSVNGEALELALEQDIDVIELEYSLINQTNKKYIDAAYKKGLGIIVRGGLGTGLLTSYVNKHLADPNLPYGDKVRALLDLTHNDFNKLTQLAMAFLHKNHKISSVIIGADQSGFIAKDIQLLKSFKDKKLLEQAEKIVAKYPTPKEFTEVMGEYYQE